MSDMSKVIDTMRSQFPWPTTRPAVAAVPWVMDYGGRGLIKNAITTRRLRFVVEIGAFVGGSVRQWLRMSPDVVVVAIDPWPQIEGPHTFYDTHPLGRAHGGQLRKPDGLYKAFLATLWEDRQRVIPVRGTGENMLPALHELGFKPDLIFIDADKQGAEIEICDHYFPEAIVCGDDWLWCDGMRFPSQQPVRESARRRGRVLKVVSNTWLIDDQPWTFTERCLWLGEMPTTARRRLTAWRRSRRGLDSAGNRSWT